MTQPLNLKEAVYNLQKYLRFISFSDPRITRPPLDGLFGSDTLRSVTDLQRTRGLPQTGSVDKLTWDTVYDEYLALKQRLERPTTKNLFPAYPDGYEAGIGDESSFIAVVQIMLNELSLIYDGYERLNTDGRFDKATEDALKLFQAASGLDATGRLDLVSFNRLASDFSSFSRF